MRNAFFYLLSLFPVAVLACTVAANVGDYPSTLDGGGTDAPSSADGPPTSSSEGGPAMETGTDAPFVDAGCGVGFAQQGAFIDVQSNPGAPPQYTGGTIVAGTYRLTSMTYFTFKSGTVQRRETLVVRGASPNGAFERLIEQQKPTGDYETIAAHGETSTFMSPTGSGGALFENPECPMIEALTGQYTSSGTTLTLYDGGESFERVYQRIP